MLINYNLLGSRICQRRKELKITQKKLAETVNISNTYLSAIETGDKSPSLDTLLLICHELGITLDYLVHGVIHTNVDDEIVEKIKLCSIENKKRIYKLVDIFVEEEKFEK